MMRQLSFLLVVFGLLLGRRANGQAQGDVRQESLYSNTLQRDYEYNVYLPAGYAGSVQSYPVIYLLHGRGDDMDAWLNVQSDFDRLIAEGSIPPIIAIMPDMPSSERASYYIDSQYTGTQFHAEAVETAFFHDLIPHVEATYRTVASRNGRLIGGYSMGGYGAIRYSLAHPEMFVGALVLSPAVYTPLPPADSSAREFGAFGKGNQLFDEQIYQDLNYPSLLDLAAHSGLGLHYFIAVGDDEYKNPNPEDRLHDLDIESHLFFNEIVRLSNVSAEFRVYDGGHDWDVWERGFVEGIQYLVRFVERGRP